MSEEWSVLEVVGTEEDAELIAGFLRSEEIPCRVESVHSHEFPVNVNVLGEVRILVQPDDVGRAGAILAARDAAGPEGGE